MNVNRNGILAALLVALFLVAWSTRPTVLVGPPLVAGGSELSYVGTVGPRTAMQITRDLSSSGERAIISDVFVATGDSIENGDALFGLDCRPFGACDAQWDQIQDSISSLEVGERKTGWFLGAIYTGELASSIGATIAATATSIRKETVYDESGLSLAWDVSRAMEEVRDNLAIRSPSSGVVTSVHIEVGDTVSSTHVLLDLEDLPGSVVVTGLDQSEVGTIGAGDSAAVGLMDGSQVAGRVVAIEGDGIRRVTGQAQWNAFISVDGESLAEGERVAVTIFPDDSRAEVLIPVSAVTSRGRAGLVGGNSAGAGVFVRSEEAVLRFTAVELSETTLQLGDLGEFFVALSGLQGSDAIIWGPPDVVMGLEDGDRIRHARAAPDLSGRWADASGERRALIGSLSVINGSAQVAPMPTQEATGVGRLAQWLVGDGDRVKGGQPLALMDRSEYKKAVNSLRSRIATAEKGSTTKTFWCVSFGWIRDGWKCKKKVNSMAIIQLRRQLLDVAYEVAETFEGGMGDWGFDLRNVDYLIGESALLRAPFDGVVTNRSVRQDGVAVEVRACGHTSGARACGAINELVVTLDPDQASKVRRGSPAVVEMDPWLRPFDGMVTGTITPRSRGGRRERARRTYAYIALKDPPTTMRPGMIGAATMGLWSPAQIRAMHNAAVGALTADLPEYPFADATVGGQEGSTQTVGTLRLNPDSDAFPVIVDQGSMGESVLMAASMLGSGRLVAFSGQDFLGSDERATLVGHEHMDRLLANAVRWAAGDYIVRRPLRVFAANQRIRKALDFGARAPRLGAAQGPSPDVPDLKIVGLGYPRSFDDIDVAVVQINEWGTPRMSSRAAYVAELRAFVERGGGLVVAGSALHWSWWIEGAFVGDALLQGTGISWNEDSVDEIKSATVRYPGEDSSITPRPRDRESRQ